MEYIPQILGSLTTVGVLVWYLKDIKRDVVKIKDNHLVHIQRDISSIKETVGRHDERISNLEK